MDNQIKVITSSSTDEQLRYKFAPIDTIKVEETNG